MAATKIGKSQFDIPAPLGYRRFTNAMLVAVLPGVTLFIQGWGFSDKATNRCLLLTVLAGALIKGIGIFLGNGQEYTPSNKQVDAANENN